MIGQDNRFKKILNLLPQTHKIRNVSIVAHVDHGKTTIADCLIASNGIIHKKQAGQLRLLDDRFDEQDRGITMKSSSISLVYQDNLINLIDSPGHLEFYSEVSSALRLTDAALLVVDVVEGVSSQTYRVLRELYEQKLSSILVLNKIDKLIVHCKMDPMQAYTHINQIIEQVNAVLGSFISKELISQNRDKKEQKIQQTKEFQELENKFYFSTEKRNIIFSSALDNWGFTTDCFAPLIAKKLNKKPQEIAKYLWGDYYFNPKTKQFSSEPRNQNDRPVCVDLVLKPIWDIFENVQSENKEKIQKIITALGLKISENTKKNYNHLLIRQILNAWLPFDVIALKRIVEVLPDPISAQNFRLPYLLGLDNQQAGVSQEIKKALSKCSFENEEPVIAFISKMVNIAKNNFNERGLNELKNDDQSTKTLGFGRIFSGKIKRGDSILVIGAKKKKITNQQGQTFEVPDIEKVQINNLYVFNGQYPDGISEAYAGNIIGIGNLDDHIYKSGTISTKENCISFVPVNLQSKSVLKVSVSTPNIQDNNKLLEGLKKLNKSDPSVEVYLSTTGDLILNTSGEVHLQKCIVDLQKIYCKIPIKTSDPIISFRQTIIWTKLDENKNEKYILQQIKKQKEKQKKILLQKFKEERLNDAELDELEKQKQKAIREWDSHVEIYESSDLTVQDTRFFFKDYQVEDEQKYSYKQQKEYKKIDHKHKGKQHTKQKFLNLGLKTNVNKQLTPNQFLWIKVKAIGYNFQVVEYLEKQLDRIKKIFSLHEQKKGNIFDDKFNQERIDFMNELFEKLKQYNTDQNVINLLKDNMVCFGPNYIGSNFLVFKNMDTKLSLYNRIMDKNEQQLPNQTCLKLNEDVLKILEDYKLTIAELENSIRLGFDLACTSGPLCNQPMVGVIFILEDIIKADVIPPQPKAQKNTQTQEEPKTQTKNEQELTKQTQKQQLQTPTKTKQSQNIQNKNFTDPFGPLAGQIMSAMKDTCVQAFLGGSPRLVEPMYYCELQTDQEYYGNVYNQLSKRRAVVISEDLHEISNVFIIKAYLPVVQSQRFCFNLQDNSKGTVNAQLRLDTWKIYNQDPFFVPLTEEQIEQNGVDNILYNAARILLDKIRAKKGMSTTEKIVVAAEKQRNLKKK